MSSSSEWFSLLKNALFPLNSRRRLIARFAYRALTSPSKAVRSLNRRNLRRVLPYEPLTMPLHAEDLASPEAPSYRRERGNAAQPAAHAHDPSDHDQTELDIKLIAFYLPQFHPIPENDAWWGRGFTEWTNVSAARPQFPGHHQPRLPGELGFYDLRVPDVQKRQIELARHYGIAAFCYHFYWFGGKILLEMPLARHLADLTMDFPFCISWANENWTRRWDGLDQDVLIAQDHSPEDDLAFIDHIAGYLRDPRYLRVDSRPLLLVYRPALLPDANQTAERWRKRCRAHGLGEIYLVLTHAFEAVDPRKFGFDAAVEFAPNRLPMDDITARIPNLKREFRGVIYDYRSAVRLAKEYTSPSYTKFRCVCPAWDNEARMPGRSVILAHADPAAYGDWLRHVCDYTVQRFSSSERLVFLNAWNEWAEAAYIEPDRRHGYAYLNKTRQVLSHYRR